MSQKEPKWSQRVTKRCSKTLEDPKVSKWSSGVSKSAPNGTKREPKDSQRVPNDGQREPKGNQMGAKMHLKIDVRKMNAKRMPKGSIPYFDLDTFLMQFPLKMHPQIDTKIDVEKVCEIMRKCFQNDAKMRSKIHDKSMKFQNL